MYHYIVTLDMFKNNTPHLFLILKEHINNLHIIVDKFIIGNIIVKVNDFNYVINIIYEDPYYLQNIVQTEELCVHAINANNRSFIYVNNQTPKLCKQVVKLDGLMLRYVNNKTDKICMKAVISNPMALQYVENKTYNICHQAITNNSSSIQYIHNPSLELCLLALDINPFSIRFIKNPSNYLCNIAIQKNPRTIKYIKNKEDDYYINVLNACGLALKHIKNQTEQMCITALNNNILADKYIKINTTKLMIYKLYLKERYGSGHIFSILSFICYPIMLWYLHTDTTTKTIVKNIVSFIHLFFLHLCASRILKYNIMYTIIPSYAHYFIIAISNLFIDQKNVLLIYNIILYCHAIGLLFRSTKIGQFIYYKCENYGYIINDVIDDVIDYINVGAYTIKNYIVNLFN